MKKLLFIIVSNLLIFNIISQNSIVSYEYWFDNDYSGSEYISVSPVQILELNTNIPVSGLNNGLHIFNIRFKDQNDLWSSCISQHFYKTDPAFFGDNYIVSFEYWFDNNYNSKVTGNVTPQNTLNFISYIDLDNVTSGLHIFNIRFKDQHNIWSSCISQHFYKSQIPSGTPNFVDAYRYWFDGDIATLNLIDVPVTTNPRVIFDDLNVDVLDTGYHIVSMQFRDLHDLWSSPVSDTFYRSLTSYQESMNPAEFAIRHEGNQILVIDPIQLGTGTYTYNHTDLKIPVIDNILEFTRYYNSLNYDRNSSLGNGWSYSYDFYIVNFCFRKTFYKFFNF